MTVERREDGWWIDEVPGSPQGCGPYRTRAEAEADRRGLERFLRELAAGRNPFG